MNDDFTVQPAPVTAAATDRRTATLARVGLLGIASAALVAVAILLLGLSAAPRGTLAAGQNSSPSDVTVDDLNGGGLPGFRGGPGGLGGITITAIDGSNISLATADGWTRTITVDSGTTYSKSGDDIALGDLAVGDQIAFRQTHEDDGTFTIDAVIVIPPHAGGTVTAVNGSTITVEQRDGTTATITVTGDTTYVVNGDSATLADVKVDMKLIAEGTKNADGSLTATRVRAGDPRDPGNWEGRGKHGFGFRFGFGPGEDGANPDATTAPSATGSNS